MMDRIYIHPTAKIYGPYPLHRAAEFGDGEYLIYLLERGYQPNTTDHDSLTALHCACIHNQVQCAEILIRYGAEVNAVSIDGGTPLCDACAVGSVACVKLLLQNNALVNPPLILSTPLHEACLKGSADCVSILIEYGARLNVNDCNYGMPLHVATLMNNPDCVRILLAAGAAVNATKIHQTALHIAAERCYYECAKILCAFGANVYASDNQNKLPIDLLSHSEGPFYDLLVDYASQPRKLQEICKRTILKRINSRTSLSFHSLGLPKTIVSYLLKM